MRHAAALLFLIPCLAFAGDRITQSNDNNVATAGDVVTGTGDSNNIALAGSLGDVDIADCLASTQFSIVIFARQGVKLNAWCAAAAYDRQGLHETAARLRCTIPEIAELFVSEEACMTGNLVAAGAVELAPEPVPIEPPPPTVAPVEDDDEQEEHDELAAALATLRADFEREQNARQRAARHAAQQREAERQEAAEFLERYQQAVEPPPPQDEEQAIAERENQ